MGNCIEFDPTKSIGDAKISYNRKFEENIDKRHRMIKEMQRDVSGHILENAENAVKAAGLKKSCPKKQPLNNFTHTIHRKQKKPPAASANRPVKSTKGEIRMFKKSRNKRRIPQGNT